MPWPTKGARVAWQAGFKVIKRPDLSTKGLITVSLKMYAADDHDIHVHILGATILRLSGRTTRVKKRLPGKMVYVTNSHDRLYLSREACVGLGIICTT